MVVGAMTSFAAIRVVSKPLVGRFAVQSVPTLFVLCLVLGLTVVVWRAKTRADAGRLHARTAAQARGTAVELQLGQALTAAEVLGALARQSGGISNFQTVALELLASRPGLASLELQPGGVVSDIVPRAGHERAIGLNVLKDAAHRPGAYVAIQRRVLTVTGPLTLDRGEPGIVVRVPVFERGRDGRDSFWGFAAVSMRLPEALARAGVDELWKEGYNYAFFALGSNQQKAVNIAARGALSLQDAVQLPVRAQNLEFCLALRPRGGWISATRVALESVGVLVVSGLLCLVLKLLESRRLTDETSEPRQAPEDRVSTKDLAVGAQAEFTRAELQERLEGTARQASEINALAQTRLKQVESSARELEAQLDATVRAAEEAARAKQAELDQARLGLAQAQQAIGELQGRLEAAAIAESKTAEVAQTRLQQDQATVADFQARLDTAKRLAREAAEGSAARLHQAEKRNRELTGRLLAAETRVAELNTVLQKAQGDLKRRQNDSTTSTGVRTAATIGPVPSKPKEIGGGEAAVAPLELSTASGPAIAAPLEPLEQGTVTAVEEKLGPVRSESRGERVATTPTPLAVPTTTTGSKADSSAHPMSHEARAEVGAHTSVPRAQRKSTRLANREPARRHDQIDLFEGQSEAGQSPADLAANARAIASTEDTRLPALELAPASAESGPPELEEAEGGPANQVNAQQQSEPQAPVLEPKEGKPAPARRMPSPPPVIPAQLRKAANEILPLLVDKDPGAKDCLKANRAKFRPAFTVEAFEDFEQCVKRSDFGTALDQLKKAAKKHGISL